MFAVALLGAILLRGSETQKNKDTDLNEHSILIGLWTSLYLIILLNTNNSDQKMHLQVIPDTHLFT